ncbi:MAG: DUF433 domain-containing protein [Roseiflexus sp.]|nr:DUF433 domain-containing protein [Roseiflexus sp.]
MKKLTRITLDPAVMGGKPCIRGLRVTVGTIVGLVASGYSTADILHAYLYLEEVTYGKRWHMPRGVSKKSTNVHPVRGFCLLTVEHTV